MFDARNYYTSFSGTWIIRADAVGKAEESKRNIVGRARCLFTEAAGVEAHGVSAALPLNLLIRAPDV